MNFRNYDPKKDKDAAFRIFNECGWVHDKKKDKFLNIFLPEANTIVTKVNKEVEVIANSAIGKMRYLNEKLELSAITAVVAGLAARKQGISSKLTAERLAEDADNGAEIGALSIFDQGYYNKLGFGNGSLMNIAAFTPSTLNIDRKPKVPIRLYENDYRKIHRSRVMRKECHGAITLPEFTTRSEMDSEKNNTGFGYFDKDGNLTHHLWFYGKGKENGPIWIRWMSYQNLDQLLDLLALIKSFEEQYHLVRMVEPPFIHLQDFINRPFLMKGITRESKNQNYIYTASFWQFRILNLQKCLGKTHINCEDIRFNLKLSDPISKHLSGKSNWNGIAGDYIITIGKNSNAEQGLDNSLPIMKASVGAFSRLWYGILPASSLVYSDGLEAPDELLDKLDKAFILPKAYIDWDF